MVFHDSCHFAIWFVVDFKIFHEVYELCLRDVLEHAADVLTTALSILQKQPSNAAMHLVNDPVLVAHDLSWKMRHQTGNYQWVLFLFVLEKSALCFKSAVEVLEGALMVHVLPALEFHLLVALLGQS